MYINGTRLYASSLGRQQEGEREIKEFEREKVFSTKTIIKRNKIKIFLAKIRKEQNV